MRHLALKGQAEHSPRVAGKRLATAGGRNESTIKLWDAATGKELGKLHGHQKAVHALAFSADGQRLASASDDHTIGLWNLATGEQEGTLRGHVGGVITVAFSPDGARLASGGWGWENVVKVWDVNAGREFRRWHPPQTRYHPFAPVQVSGGLACSPDGTRLASQYGSPGQTEVKMWDRATGKELHTMKGRHAVNCVLFSPDGRSLALGCDNGTVQLFDVASGKEKWSGKQVDAIVSSLAFRSDGQVLAVGDHAGTVKLWDTASGKVLHAIERPAGETTEFFQSLAFTCNSDGSKLATGSMGVVRVWDLATNKTLLTMKTTKEYVRGLVFHPDGSRLFAGVDKEVKVWDTTTGQEVASLKSPYGFNHRGALSLVGDRLVWAYQARSSIIYERVPKPAPPILTQLLEQEVMVEWDGTPLTAQAELEREAASLVDFWFDQALPKEEVLLRLRSSRTIGEEVRKKALDFAARFPDKQHPGRQERP